nr:mitochondrial proton/calcium exchanger protein-like [Tanacetum cinerariifolium]
LPNVSSSVSSSASNMNMSLVGDYRNKYNYGDFSDGPEGNTRPTSNKDVALEETINADVQQQARAMALDKQQQLCKALPVLASASSVSREHEESLKLVKDVPDGASSALINRDYDGRIASATASTTPTGPTPPSAQEVSIQDLKNSVGSLEETVKKHITKLSAAINLLTMKSKPSSDVFKAAESSPLEDEDHCPPVFKPTTSEERPIESVEEDHFTPVAEGSDRMLCLNCLFVCTTYIL